MWLTHLPVLVRYEVCLRAQCVQHSEDYEHDHTALHVCAIFSLAKHYLKHDDRGSFDVTVAYELWRVRGRRYLISSTYVDKCVNTHEYTYIHAYIHTYMTRMHTYMHKCTIYMHTTCTPMYTHAYILYAHAHPCTRKIHICRHAHAYCAHDWYHTSCSPDLAACTAST